jgi:hypothetical protein
MKMRYQKVIGMLLVPASVTHAFVVPLTQVTPSLLLLLKPRQQQSLTMSFFKDILGKAFENDASLDKDKAKGQYDGPEDDGLDVSMSVGRVINSNNRNPQELTETQKRWRESQQGLSSSSSTPQLLLTRNSQWKLDLFLTGIPARDPSNDLFASKVNVSTRDRKVGLMVPEEPTVSDIQITLLEDGVCQVLSDSEFIDSTNTNNGSWKVSSDGAMIRICLNVMGYQRTVQTKGSIQKIYWSQEDDTAIQTSSAYTIPAGPLYGDAKLLPGKQVGTLQMMDGLLRVEQSAGLLGAGSRMVPCGRFSAQRVDA